MDSSQAALRVAREQDPSRSQRMAGSAEFANC